MQKISKDFYLGSIAGAGGIVSLTKLQGANK